jgi:putative phage-type endonuclease
VPEIVAAQRSPEWYAARKDVITASTAAACLGIGPNKELWAYNQICGDGQEDNRHMAWGREHEEKARNAYEVLSGNLVIPCGFWLHQDYPWLGASPDGLVGDDVLVEVKCPQSLPTEIPPHHEIQMRVQLAVTDRFFCDYYVWLGREEFCRQIKRDLTIETDLLKRLKAFWETYVQTKTPPARRRTKKEGAA